MLHSDETSSAEVTWSCPRGKARVWQPAKGTLALKVTGYLQKDGAEAIVAAMQRVVTLEAPVVTFNDWFEMNGYDSEARLLMTSWVLSSRSKFSAIHVLVHSKLVAMGVSVANLALGGLISTYTSPKVYNATFNDFLNKRARGAADARPS
jgi:hypothetical protein